MFGRVLRGVLRGMSRTLGQLRVPLWVLACAVVVQVVVLYGAVNLGRGQAALLWARAKPAMRIAEQKRLEKDNLFMGRSSVFWICSVSLCPCF